MSLPVEILEYLNENSHRAFPFKETVTRTSSDGVLTIPDDFLVDLSCSIGNDITDRFYVSALLIDADVVVVSLSDISGVVGTFTITPSADRNTTVYMSAEAAFVGAVGKLVVGSTSGLFDGPVGSFTFGLDTAELESTCFYPSMVAVNRLVFEDATGATTSYTGNITITAGRNIGFIGIDTTTVKINAGEGLGLNTSCVDVSPILSINGVGPNHNGEFFFDTTDCASLGGIENGIKLINTCCKPCNSCTEVTELITRIITVENNLLALRNTYQGMLTEYQALKQALTCTC